MPPKARILCLHGYAQNGDFFRQRTGALRKALKACADFTFVDAPHPATAEFLGDVPEERGAALGWFNVGETTPGARPALSAQYVGMEAALDTVRTACQADGPFDGVLGFSQGAILITMLSARRLKRAREGVGPPPSWRSNVLICGMPVRAEGLRRELGLDETPLEFPCTIAQGTSDPFYPWARRVDEHYVAPTTVSYDEGHRFPHDRQATAALAESILVNLRIADAVADEET